MMRGAGGTRKTRDAAQLTQLSDYYLDHSFKSLVLQASTMQLGALSRHYLHFIQNRIISCCGYELSSLEDRANYCSTLCIDSVQAINIFPDDIVSPDYNSTIGVCESETLLPRDGCGQQPITLRLPSPMLRVSCQDIPVIVWVRKPPSLVEMLKLLL